MFGQRLSFLCKPPLHYSGLLELNANDVTIKAGVEETTSTSSETTRTAGSSYSTNGGASANASGSNTDSDSYSKTHINSTINAGSLTSTSDNLTLSGANVEVAGGIDIDTGNLVIESLQDESSSSRKTEGYSVGAGVSASSMNPSALGANENSSSADSQWVNNQTTLIGGTSGEGDVNISADKTTLKGAVVASATRNEDGTLTDNGTLNLATDELIIEDIKDKDHSENKGFDISAGLSSSGSSTVGLTSDGHKTEQTTFATLGGGNITQKDGSEHDISDVNSDLNNSQEITKDMKTGGLNASVTIDHRLVGENGRNDIAEDFEKSGELAVQVGEAVVDGADYVADEIAVLGDDLPEELKDKLGETGERFVDELIREDLSDEQIADILAREKIQDGLEGVELADQQLSDDPSLAERNPDESTIPEVDSTIIPTGDEVALETVTITPDDPSALEIGAAGLGKVQQELDTLHEENADLAFGVEVAIGVATGGPLKEGIGQAINHGIEQIAGEEMADLETAMNNYAGGYITDEGKEGFTDNLADERLEPYENAEIGNSSVDISDGLRMAAGTILGIGGGRKTDAAPTSSNKQPVDTNIVIGEKRVASNESSGMKKQLEIAKVEPYGESQKKTGDGTVDREHNPPKQALLERAREIKGKELTAAEKRRIVKNSDTVTLPRKDVHQKASSSKGYNAAKAKEDAKDLQAATRKYSNEHIENSKDKPYYADVKAACDKMSCKTNKEHDEFIEKQLDRKK